MLQKSFVYKCLRLGSPVLQDWSSQETCRVGKTFEAYTLKDSSFWGWDQPPRGEEKKRKREFLAEKSEALLVFPILSRQRYRLLIEKKRGA